ncbi:LuxR family transcriptional regulator [Enterobacter sp. Bisph1]|uniref:helix-turn-helix transcriptional regulator n=1 Tax=Enterobacter sp. Bisph1 TaxID=1274399 RepID=UPI00057C03CB|nr:LuxR family transcriptional regulator [Enterobacter sp. Bisph1]
MILMVTKDTFLLSGITSLVKDENIIKIEKTTDISHLATDTSTKVIIDLYHNNVIDDATVSTLQTLKVGAIIVLTPFHISKLKNRSPLFFINRKMPMESWLSLLTEKQIPYRKPRMGFSHNQFKIVSHFLNEELPYEIAAALKITEQTLRSQKFNIMFKLKLRRMSDIVTLNISPYF